MKKIIFVSFCFIVFMFTACKQKTSQDNGNVVTRKISYPVFINSPYEDTDWWVENIEGSDRDKFVNLLIDAALSGKVKAYSFLDEHLLSMDEVKKCMEKEILIETGDIDSVVISKVDRQNIERISFLEAWHFNESEFTMHKEVLALAPAETLYDEEGEMLGYKPLFWIYLGKNVPEKK